MGIYRKYGALDFCRTLSQRHLDSAAHSLQELLATTNGEKLNDIIRIFGYWTKLSTKAS